MVPGTRAGDRRGEHRLRQLVLLVDLSGQFANHHLTRPVQEILHLAASLVS
jgi:hypothetical protein